MGSAIKDILIAGGGSALTLLIVWVVSKASTGIKMSRKVDDISAALEKKIDDFVTQIQKKIEAVAERDSKRLNRVEQIVPQVARGMIVILRIHMHEETNGDIKKSLDELTETATGLMVSQKDPG